ncbi:MAG: glycosyltransferase family 4 protein [Leptolyngbyaceae cyanobacterium bins.302]|nr:glycosyltransferase family 4 protein [Leptolyngbyaceae cyanobacterium bins.302]
MSMKIGHYDSEMWSKGGVASYIRRVGQYQRAAGHTVYYFSNRPAEAINPLEAPIVIENNQELFAQAQAMQLDILHVHKGLRISPPDHLPVIRTLHGHQPYCPSGSRYLKRWKCPCDRQYSPLGCFWGHVVDHCGSIKPEKLLFNFDYTQWEKRVLPTMPTLVVSQFLKNQMIQAGYPPELIHVLHLFAPNIANELPPPRTDVPHIVFLGRIAPQKGLEWLLKSLKQVSCPVHLDIAGDGYQEPEMRALAQRLQLNNVTFHGWVSPQDVNGLIRGARALIFPSIWHEPGGTVAFEAMANSRATIMSRVGGMPEVVLDGINGLLVAPNDVDEMARSIATLCQDWEFAAHLGQRGRRLAEQYSLQNHMEQLMQFYQQTIARKSKKVAIV